MKLLATPGEPNYVHLVVGGAAGHAYPGALDRHVLREGYPGRASVAGVAERKGYSSSHAYGHS